MLSMLKNVADFVTPVLTESHFTEKGVLTPEEFVAAGDQLVFACRTWAWSSGPKGSEKKYLPADKQFLITRNVPSMRRAHTYALADAQEEVIRGAGSAEMDDAEGWLSTHSQEDMAKARAAQDIDGDAPQCLAAQMQETHISGQSAASSSSSSSTAAAVAKPVAPVAASGDDEIGDIDDLDAPVDNLLAPPAAKPAAPAAASSKPAAAPADDFPDMEAFEDDNNVLAPASQESKQGGAKHPQGYLRAEEPEDNIVKTRSYDISIVYDKYYRTPRVYLFGYDEHRQPLTPDQIMEDISADHANKTVTVEAHPFLGVPHASIHPCKHAHVMKRIVDQMTSAGQKTVDVQQYMFIFLKFISSVLPTIEYDYTLSA